MAPKGKPFSHHGAQPSTVSRESSSRCRSRGAPFSHHAGAGADDMIESPQQLRSTSSRLNTTSSSIQGFGVQGEEPGLVQAASKGEDAMRAELISCSGQNIDARNNLQATCLMVALDECPIREVGDVVKLLLVHQADANAIDTAGDTPLMYCINRTPDQQPEARVLHKPNMLLCIKLLLSYQADPEQQNKRSRQHALEMSKNMFQEATSIMEEEIRLRNVEANLSDWRKGRPIPKVPRQVDTAAESAISNGYERAAAHLKAYSKAINVLQQYQYGIELEFHPPEMGFVPASSHSALNDLRDALQDADAYLREYGALPTALGHLVFEGLLPLHEEANQMYVENYKAVDAQDALVRFVASKRDAYLQGYNWAFDTLIEPKEREELRKVVELASSFPSGTGAKKPRQIKSSLQEVMTDASVAQKRVLLLAASLAERYKATHLVVRRPSGGRTEPSQKRFFRSNEKVLLGNGPEALLDVARGGIECPSMKSVGQTLQGLLEEQKKGTLVLLRIKMRFHEPSDGGWRDALINFAFTDDPSQHVCELQIMHKKMMTIRSDMGAHHDYAQFRGAVELLEQYGVDWQERAKQINSGLADTGQSGSEREIMQAQRIQQLEAELAVKQRCIVDLQFQLQGFRGSGKQAGNKGKESQKQQILENFSQWDLDGSGTINKDELKQMMLKGDSTLDQDDCEKLFDAVDTDNDGQIDFQEFVKWLFTSKR